MKKPLILIVSLILISAFLGLLLTNPATKGIDKEISQIKKVYTELDTAIENVYPNRIVMNEKNTKQIERFAYVQN